MATKQPIMLALEGAYPKRGSCSVGQYPEDLGLCPDLSRLPEEILDLIQHGDLGGTSHSEAGMAVCATMFRASYNLAEVWMVMTDPTNGISETFFEADGERAEAHLELLISEAYEATTMGGW